MSETGALPLPEVAQQPQQSLFDLINSQTQIDRVRALVKLLEIQQQKIKIVGEDYDILNIEMMTEYSNPKSVQFMVRNETWRKSVQEVIHAKTIDEADTLVGFMDTQIMLKMISYKRKRATEYINGLKGQEATAELIPTNTRKKRFFGMM